MGKSRTKPPAASLQASPVEVGSTLALAWLVPGGGFLVHGRVWRGLALFLVVNLTFFIGILMHGGVAWPIWSSSDQGFNVVNNLTFIIQLGDGLSSLASLYASSRGAGGWLSILSADPSHPLYDLSSFYLLVAGAMNYFIVCNTYDRLFAASAEAEESEPSPGEKAS